MGTNEAAMATSTLTVLATASSLVFAYVCGVMPGCLSLHSFPVHVRVSKYTHHVLKYLPSTKLAIVPTDIDIDVGCVWHWLLWAYSGRAG